MSRAPSMRAPAAHSGGGAQLDLFNGAPGRVVVSPHPTIVSALIWGLPLGRDATPTRAPAWVVVCDAHGRVLVGRWPVQLLVGHALHWPALADGLVARGSHARPLLLREWLDDYERTDAFDRWVEAHGGDPWRPGDRRDGRVRLERASGELLSDLVARTRDVSPQIALRAELVVLAAAAGTETAKLLAWFMAQPISGRADLALDAWAHWPTPLRLLAARGGSRRARRLRSMLAAGGGTLAEVFSAAHGDVAGARAALRVVFARATTPWIDAMTPRAFERLVLVLAASKRLRELFPRDADALQAVTAFIDASIPLLRRFLPSSRWAMAFEWLLARGRAAAPGRMQRLERLRGALVFHGPPDKRARRALLLRIVADPTDGALDEVDSIIDAVWGVACPQQRIAATDDLLAALPAGLIYADAKFEARWLRSASEASSHGARLGQCIASAEILADNYVAWGSALIAIARAEDGEPAATVAVAFEIEPPRGSGRGPRSAAVALVEEQGDQEQSNEDALGWFRGHVLERLAVGLDDAHMQCYLRRRSVCDALQARRSQRCRAQLESLVRDVTGGNS